LLELESAIVALAPGTRIGPYEVAEQIGAGGMGEVYRATDTHLARHVAIKVLPATVASDAERLARFEREARTLASLNHPNIAAVYGLEKNKGTMALVMELVEGPTLAEQIAERPLPLHEALRVAGQIAEAMDAAHETGIVHRDLKPANIKLRTDGTVKVLDFGLAKALSQPGSGGDQAELTTALTREQGVLGTPSYMSPEQTRGLVVDRRTDVWAFGCVLFEMLTGRRAFDGATTADVMAHVLGTEPDWTVLPLATPPSVRRLVKRCLEKDVKRRQRDIADARADLVDLNADRPDVKRFPGGVAATDPLVTASGVGGIRTGNPGPGGCSNQRPRVMARCRSSRRAHAGSGRTGHAGR
jgi:serine/threonine protein kinase